MTMAAPRAGPYRYAAYWCEENAWHLVADLGREPAHVILIDNAFGRVLMAHQQAGRGRAVLWDYHVVVAAGPEEERCIFDLDTTLPFGAPLGTWLDLSFPHDAPSAERPIFRILSAAQYRESLSTDRRHMRTAEGFQALPPFWSPPWDPARGHTLPSLLPSAGAGLGVVVDRAGLRAAW